MPDHDASSNATASNDKAGSFGAVFLTTFTTVFLAELGDKTQLAALLLSAESGRPVLVFIGASLALISSSLVGVVLGRWLSRVLPPQQARKARRNLDDRSGPLAGSSGRHEHVSPGLEDHTDATAPSRLHLYHGVHWRSSVTKPSSRS